MDPDAIGYITISGSNEMLEAKKDVGRMLGTMIQNPGPFLRK
jgi:hypothetical protein